MKILMVGGGSGGHITPLVAVAQEIKAQSDNSLVFYVGKKGEPLADVISGSKLFDGSYNIFAGKFRRYHGSKIKQFLDIKTICLNVRDAFFLFIGFWQSLWLLYRFKPDIIFVKGGFVGVPIGLAAVFLRKKYITHDSDAIPGLANRIIGRWAKFHLVAYDKSIYSYDKAKTLTVGVPIGSGFRPYSDKEVRDLRHKLGIASSDKVVLLTGGGNGARSLNLAMLYCADKLLPVGDITIIMLVGKNNLDSIQEKALKSASQYLSSRKLIIKDYAKDIDELIAVADIVVARAGATSLVEFSAQEKACIIVPNPNLTGGHQLKNAAIFSKNKAIVVLDDKAVSSNSEILLSAIEDLLNDQSERQRLARAISRYHIADSAKKIANILVKNSSI